MKTITCCLVGYGGIAVFHTEALKKIPGVVLHTLVGRRAEPAEEFKNKMGFQKSTTDFDSALADPDIDAVVITAPNELHYDLSKRALEAGKHVLLEIPLAMSHKSARDLAGLVRKTDLKLLVAHTRRYDPVGQFVKDFIASGKAGQVHHHHCHEFWLRHENIGWTGYNRSWVDDVLFHHGCHMLDFSLWAIGAPARRIRGELSPLHAKTGTSMDVSMLVRYANETMATLSLSYNSPRAFNGNLFICDNGTLSVSAKKVSLNNDLLFEGTGSLAEHVLAQNTDFVNAIRENRQPACNAEHGLAAITLLQQVYDQMVTLEDEEKYRRMWNA
ncbi:MAG: Gfo/Idh/MocA family oxidoreductase [bacterium]|nr:Gfo/Idh/MocA family oxidoreductase [bacterium]